MYHHFLNNRFDKTLRVDPDVYDKVVFLSDIHGEYQKFLELKTALNGFDKCLVICLGDIVDRGPDPVGVLREFMREKDYELLMLAGNHEVWLYNWITEDKERGCPYYYNTGEKLKHIPEEEVQKIAEWIAGLPISMSVEIAGQVFELAHASIIDDSNYDPEDLLVCSHVKRLLFSGESILRLRGTCAILGTIQRAMCASGVR